MYGSTLSALRGGGWVSNFQEKKRYVTLAWSQSCTWSVTDKEVGLVDKILSNCDSIKTAVINVLEFYTQVQETGAITGNLCCFIFPCTLHNLCLLSIYFKILSSSSYQFITLLFTSSSVIARIPKSYANNSFHVVY